MVEEKRRVRIVSGSGKVEASPTDNGRQDIEVLPTRGLEEVRRTTSQENKLLMFEHAKPNHQAGDCRIILRQSVFEQINKHLASNTSRELGGLLLGREFNCPNSAEPIVIIDYALDAQYTEGTPVRLNFSVDTWTDFEQRVETLKQRNPDLRRLGWYHSHPNIEIFLSRWDLDVCTNFTRATSIALVVDPVNYNGGFFIKGKTDFRAHEPQGFWLYQDIDNPLTRRWQNLFLTNKRWEGTSNAELEKILEPLPANSAVHLSQSVPDSDLYKPELPTKVWNSVSPSPHNLSKRAVIVQAIIAALWLLASIAFIGISIRNTESIELLANRIAESEKIISSLKNDVHYLRTKEATFLLPAGTHPPPEETPSTEPPPEEGNNPSRTGPNRTNKATPAPRDRGTSKRDQPKASPKIPDTPDPGNAPRVTPKPHENPKPGTEETKATPTSAKPGDTTTSPVKPRENASPADATKSSVPVSGKGSAKEEKKSKDEDKTKKPKPEPDKKPDPKKEPKPNSEHQDA